MKIHPQKNTLLQAAQGNAKTKACKRVFFSATQEKLFSSLPFFIFFSHAQTATQSGQDNISTRNDLTVLTEDRRAADNSGFKKLAVQWLIEHSTSHQHLWWLDSFVLRNRQLLKPANRWRKFLNRASVLKSKEMKLFQLVLIILLLTVGLSSCRRGDGTIAPEVIVTQPMENQVFSVSDTITIAGTAKRQGMYSIEAAIIASPGDTVFKVISLVSGDSIPFVYKTTVNTPGIYEVGVIGLAKDDNYSFTGGTVYFNISVQ